MNDPRVGLDTGAMDDSRPRHPWDPDMKEPGAMGERRRSGSWDFGLAKMFSMGRRFPEDVAADVPSFRQRSGSIGSLGSIDSNRDSLDGLDSKPQPARRTSFVSQMFAMGRHFPEDAAGGLRKDRD